MTISNFLLQIEVVVLSQIVLNYITLTFAGVLHIVEEEVTDSMLVHNIQTTDCREDGRSWQSLQLLTTTTFW